MKGVKMEYDMHLVSNEIEDNRKPEDRDNKIFWLDKFQGEAKGGLMYRSKTAIDIETVEEKFNVKVVGIKIDPDYESGRASWTIEYITAVEEDK
tara:strand:- start:591 stop:872 length:282 start_codon:yes stop_codon:yes gene_type:complete